MRLDPGTVIALAALCGSAAVGCKSKSKSKPAERPEQEAIRNLEQIAKSAKSYYLSTGRASMPGWPGKHQPMMFPVTTRLTPRRSCASRKSRPFCKGSTWTNPTWKALEFAIKGKHRYQYQLISTGDSAHATFTARAVRRLGRKESYEVLERTGKAVLGDDVVLSKKVTTRHIKSRSELNKPERSRREVSRCINDVWGRLTREQHNARCARTVGKRCLKEAGFRTRHPALCYRYQRGYKKLGETCQEATDCRPPLTCHPRADKCGWKLKCEDFAPKLKKCIAEVYAQMRPKSQDRLAKMSPARRTRFLGRMNKIMAKGLCNNIRHGLPYDLELKLKKVTLKTPCKELAPLIKIGLAPPKR